MWSFVVYASRPDLTRALGNVSSPALLIRGSKDLLMSQRTMEALARAIPGARLEVVPGSGHMTIAEQPDKVAGLVDGFVQDVLGGFQPVRASRPALGLDGSSAGETRSALREFSAP